MKDVIRDIKEIAKPKNIPRLIILGSLVATSCAIKAEPTDKSIAAEKMLASGEWLSQAFFFHSEQGHLTMHMAAPDGNIYIDYSGDYWGESFALGPAIACEIGDDEPIPIEGRLTMPSDKYSPNQVVEVSCKWKDGHTETVVGSYPDPNIAYDLNSR